MKHIRIGCSGWNYRHWRGVFYPDKLPVKRWLEHYAGTFDTVEINASFYRLPKPETFAKWREQAPSDFCYAVKANRFLTQAKKLKDCEEPLERMLGAMRHLGDRLGPILYQLPPSLHLNLQRLETFLALLPRDLTHVFEFRHNSWLAAETLALLERHGASFCAHDMPGSATPRWATGKAASVRFQGTAGKYVGRYSRAALVGWAVWLCEQGRTVWVYFNNDIHADAIEDALALRSMVQRC
jgi:uncharacterized protein YecE (DUF72 family)